MNKRWKPHFNERYYSVGNGGVLEPGTWLNDFVDIAMYKLGNCYATPEEAEANMEKWTKWYSSDDWDGDKKTCPFCGGRAVVYADRVRLGGYDTGCLKQKMICTGCGCSVSFPGSMENPHTSLGDAKKNTIDAWNRRF
jgi:hypothetical protein